MGIAGTPPPPQSSQIVAHSPPMGQLSILKPPGMGNMAHGILLGIDWKYWRTWLMGMELPHEA